MNLFLKTGEHQEGYDCVSSIVQLGDFFYLSGQLGHGATFREQCIDACYRLSDALAQFDLRFDHVLKFTVYLTDIEMKDEFLSVFANFADQPYPTMTIVESPHLPDQAMICIDGCGVNTLRHERSMNKAYCEDCDE
ncbi:MAG: RidA family protein [Erysipelotrichaceae bacterium]|nr:RidA family protein [Erysipelotrichaceae bacterium]